MDEHKYKSLFIYDLEGNQYQFNQEFKRIKNEHGDSDEIKLEFYKGAFRSIITFHKKHQDKDDLYGRKIEGYYKSFINALKQDKIDAAEFVQGLEDFKNKELPNIKIVQNTSSAYIPEYKQYNPNTKYGRRKAREQAQRNYENGTPEYRDGIDSIKVVLWIIVIGFAFVLYLIKRKLGL